MPQNGGIRYGLVCIKNVGRLAVEGIVKERNANGKFKDFTDFARRVPSDALNRRMIESLIKGGAFDCFGKGRFTLLANYEQILDMESHSKSLLDGGQMFFDFLLQEEYKYVEVKENRRMKLQYEKEVTGRYITGHPLDGYEEEFKAFNFNTSMLLPIEEETMVDDEEEGEANTTYQVKDGDRIYFGGLLSGVTVKTSQKTGKRWGYAILEDLYGSAEVVFYNRVYSESKNYIEDDALVRIRGKIVISGDDVPPKIEVLSVTPWALEEKEIIEDTRTLCVRIENDVQLYQRVMELLDKNKGVGGCKVILQVETLRDDGTWDKKGYRLPFKVEAPDALKSTLIGLVGYNNVKIID